jgi:hypothetical protein
MQTLRSFKISSGGCEAPRLESKLLERLTKAMTSTGFLEKDPIGKKLALLFVDYERQDQRYRQDPLFGYWLELGEIESMLEP